MSTAVAPGLRNRVKTSLPPEYEDVGKSGQPVATFLGLFSIGLGLWELAAPRSVARTTGAHLHPQLIQAYGLRELMAGFGLLTQRDAVPGWLWARVAGDVLDLATLGAAYNDARSQDQRNRVMASIAAVAGVTLIDVLSAQDHTRHPS